MIRKNDPKLFLNRINNLLVIGKLYEHHEYRNAEYIPEEIIFWDGKKDEHLVLISKRHVILRALKKHTITELYKKEEFEILKVYLLSVDQLCNDFLTNSNIRATVSNFDDAPLIQRLGPDKLDAAKNNYINLFKSEIINEIVKPYKKYVEKLISSVFLTKNLMMARKVIFEFTGISTETILSRQPKAQFSFILRIGRRANKLPHIYQYLHEEGWIDSSCSSENFINAFSNIKIREKIIWKRSIKDLKLYLAFLYENFIHDYEDSRWATANNIISIPGKDNLTTSLTNSRDKVQSKRLKDLIAYTKEKLSKD
jgi:hypothetical protein